jgi:hypothetical protein
MGTTPTQYRAEFWLKATTQRPRALAPGHRVLAISGGVGGTGSLVVELLQGQRLEHP